MLRQREVRLYDEVRNGVKAKEILNMTYRSAAKAQEQ